MQESLDTPAAVPPGPRCAATHVVRNGPTHPGTPSFRGRRFVARPRNGPVTGDHRQRVERLLAERLSLRAIARTTRRSRSWLQGFVNARYREDTPWEPGLLKKRRARS